MKPVNHAAAAYLLFELLIARHYKILVPDCGGLTRPIPRDVGADQLRGVPIIGKGLDSRKHGRVVKSAVIDGERDQHGRGSKPTRSILLCP